MPYSQKIDRSNSLVLRQENPVFGEDQPEEVIHASASIQSISADGVDIMRLVMVHKIHQKSKQESGVATFAAAIWIFCKRLPM